MRAAFRAIQERNFETQQAKSFTGKLLSRHLYRKLTRIVELHHNLVQHRARHTLKQWQTIAFHLKDVEQQQTKIQAAKQAVLKEEETLHKFEAQHKTFAEELKHTETALTTEQAQIDKV